MSSFLLLGSSSKKLALHTLVASGVPAESRSRSITPGDSTGLAVGRGGGVSVFWRGCANPRERLAPFQCSRTAHERLRLFLLGPFGVVFAHLFAL